MAGSRDGECSGDFTIRPAGPRIIDLTLRAATVADATAIATLHLAVRQATYAGQLPAAVLAADTLAGRIALWTARLADPAIRAFVAERAGRPAGLASGGPMPARPAGREPLPGYDGYLASLYVDPAAHGAGLGAALLRRVAAALAADGCTSLALHTLATNRARGFYERLGARAIREETAHGAGQSWTMVAYGWTDLTVLLPSPI